MDIKQGILISTVDFFLNIYIYRVYSFILCVLPACVSVHHVCAVPSNARRGHQNPCNGVTEDCELPFGCWESSPGPLGEQPVLLTTKSSLQPLHLNYKNLCVL